MQETLSCHQLHTVALSFLPYAAGKQQLDGKMPKIRHFHFNNCSQRDNCFRYCGVLFLWKYSKIYYRKPMWLPVFYLSRSYSGIKNFTLRFYKILEDARRCFKDSIQVCLLVCALSVLDYKSCFILFESMIAVCLIDCNPKIILYESTSYGCGFDCKSSFPIYGSTIVWGGVDLKSGNSKMSQWSWGISMTAFPKFCT